MSDDTTAGPGPDAGIEIETNEVPSNDSANEPASVEPVEDDHEDNTSEHVPDKRKNGRQRQLEGLRNVISDKDRQIAELMKRLDVQAPKQEPQQDQKSAQAEAEDDPEPKITDYKDVLDYTDARAEWRVRQAIKAYEKSQTEKQNKANEEQAYQKKIDTYREKADALLEKVPDFYEKVDQLIEGRQITKSMQDAVLDSPMSELVTLHLLNHPDDLKIMQGLDDKGAAVAVAKIEAYIQQSMTSPQTETVAKPTKAAAPINPVGKSATASTKAPEQMNEQEWEAYAAKLSGRKTR